MHMADALISPAVGLTMDAIGVAAIGLCVAKAGRDGFSEKKVPVMGVAGAMVFAAQMINFTIPATGSSGHIGGGILLAGLLGGVPAFLSVTAVLIIQCLFFADGGLLALGCNIFNLGVIPCLVAYPLIFRPFLRNGVNYRRLSAASVAAAVAGLALGAFCVVLQTSLSGITRLPFGAFTALMLPIHTVIGLVEGVVTAGVLCFVFKMRPEIIESAQTGTRLDDEKRLPGEKRHSGTPVKSIVIALAALALITGGALSLLSSAKPDGLEWAVGKTEEKAGFGEAGHAGDRALIDAAARAQENTAFLPDYSLAGDPGNAAGTSVAGVIGAAATFALAGATGLVISVLVHRRRKTAASQADAGYKNV